MTQIPRKHVRDTIFKHGQFTGYVRITPIGVFHTIIGKQVTLRRVILSNIAQLKSLEYDGKLEFYKD